MIIREIMDYNAFHFTDSNFFESNLIDLFLFELLSKHFAIQYDL